MQHHQHITAAAGTCPDCDGFPKVEVTTGERDADGSRRTVVVVCRGCAGTGYATAAPTLPARVMVFAGGAA
ncbi:hypothetical protein [Streptomyces sp. NPDC054975]